MKTHKLSSKLLPPSLFFYLKNIEKLLPIDLRLAGPVDVEDLFIYCDLCRVQVVSTIYSIILIVAIPFTSSASRFETYKLHSNPVQSAYQKLDCLDVTVYLFTCIE